tara:strand:+ start:89 stop:253 length:165 start_codon:yes stop_codon:yes gene_type:complete
MVVTRQFLMEGFAAHRDKGAKLISAEDLTIRNVRAISVTQPAESDWQEAGAVGE